MVGKWRRRYLRYSALLEMCIILCLFFTPWFSKMYFLRQGIAILFLCAGILVFCQLLFCFVHFIYSSLLHGVFENLHLLKPHYSVCSLFSYYLLVSNTIQCPSTDSWRAGTPWYNEYWPIDAWGDSKCYMFFLWCCSIDSVSFDSPNESISVQKETEEAFCFQERVKKWPISSWSCWIQ